MPTSGSSVLRYWMPLLVPFIRNSTFSSKSLTVPPRQIRKLFWVTTFSAVVSPTISPFSTRQKRVSPSHPVERLAVEDRHEPGVVVRLGLGEQTAAAASTGLAARRGWLTDP